MSRRAARRLPLPMEAHQEGSKRVVHLVNVDLPVHGLAHELERSADPDATSCFGLLTLAARLAVIRLALPTMFGILRHPEGEVKARGVAASRLHGFLGWLQQRGTIAACAPA